MDTQQLSINDVRRQMRHDLQRSGTPVYLAEAQMGLPRQSLWRFLTGRGGIGGERLLSAMQKSGFVILPPEREGGSSEFTAA